MAWDEWEQLRAAASERQSARMQLNHVDPGGGGTYGPYIVPSQYGDLKVKNSIPSPAGSAVRSLSTARSR